MRLKSPVSEDDVNIILNLLENIKPDQIFAAGDLSDPHGTHRVCLDAILIALRKGEGRRLDEKMLGLVISRSLGRVGSRRDRNGPFQSARSNFPGKREAILRHQSQKEGAYVYGRG